MDTTKWNDWLTLVANFGVVIGLGMLIFELKHASDLAEVSAYQTRMTEISETAKALALSEDLADIYERMLSDGFASLTPVEQRRVRSWELGVTVRMQAQFYQYQRGFLDEMSIQEMLRHAKGSLPIWRELSIPLENPAFVEAAEQVEANPDRIL